jgi:asparagine synthase (glutamine-hydrolysing)
MCAIVGLRLKKSLGNLDVLAATIRQMSDSMLHRGPDSGDVWCDLSATVALGHRRLAIRDLSPAGAQPMHSACGNFVIVYNGEVYSHREIARDLASQGHYLRGSSDTEVILEACARWGVDAVVPRLIGMFAFALFDRRDGSITLVRDRLGIKPLYWGIHQDQFFFSSELKALAFLPRWAPRLDHASMASFMRHNYIPAPWTIYKDVHKLEAGGIVHCSADLQITQRSYWCFLDVVHQGLANLDSRAPSQILADLDALLTDAVGKRMIADVPLGTLLSGGVDSSLVSALMVEQSQAPINSFSIGFPEKGFDEAPFAAGIAKHLGTNHTELYVTSKDGLDIVPKLSDWYDEPFADSSQIPTALVCHLTRQHVKVVLSGDGGDELFAGYTRYGLGLEAWQKANIAPWPFRKFLARMLLKTPESLLDRLGPLVPGRLRPNQLGLKLHKFGQALLLNDPDAMYRRMVSHWDEPGTVVPYAPEHKGVLWDKKLKQRVPDFLDRMQVLDTLTYLPDDILTKVDRASMSCALEARVPLLDHRVVAFAWALPQKMKVRDGQTKWALRQVLYKRVPKELIERPKMGFGVPFADWLRGPLRPWAEDLLSEPSLRQRGVFNPAPIRQRWDQHIAGENWGYPLWNVLMAQDWLKKNPKVQT